MARDSEQETAREYWNGRYSSRGRGGRVHSAFLERYARVLPRQGIAIDIACGTGENVAFLARDLDVLGVDVSDVAIGLARGIVNRPGMRGKVQLVVDDVTAFLGREATGKYALLTSINFFEPGLVPDMKRVLSPGGMAVLQAFTTRDERLSASERMRDKLVTEMTLFEPAMFGSYWILASELDDFTDGDGYKRQRVNLIARKPH